jgi:glycosyltransferase involved in cell wall biosynthesis
MLRVAQISFFADPQERAPADLLSAWPTVTDTAECAVQGGVAVSVIQAAAQRETLLRNGIAFHFLRCDRPERDAAQRAQLAALLTELAPDVLHVQGLGFPAQVCALASLVTHIPIVLQDHASPLPRFWRRGPLRRCAQRIAGVAFCARAQAQPFTAAGVFGPQLPIYEIPESSSRFLPADRRAARAAAQVDGDPLLLWIGHLDDNKDPLTVLDGVAAAVEQLPGLVLACCYVRAPLLAAVQQRIANDQRLRSRVKLLGPVPHERVQLLLQAADLFVLGSHREGSGYSLIEAMACGASPVVTDIPSFRSLTGHGAVGRLWPCGEGAALAAAIVDLAACDQSAERQRVRAHFEAELSFAAVGRKLAAMYADLHTRARPPRTPLHVDRA